MPKKVIGFYQVARDRMIGCQIILFNRVLASLIASAVFLSGCNDLLSEYLDSKCIDMKFERFIETDKIIITDNMNNKLRTIVNKEIINKIVDFSLSHKTNWIAPFGGTPIPSVSASLYSEGEFIGDFGVGNNTIVAQGCDYFYSREISIKEKNFILVQ